MKKLMYALVSLFVLSVSVALAITSYSPTDPHAAVNSCAEWVREQAFDCTPSSTMICDRNMHSSNPCSVSFTTKQEVPGGVDCASGQKDYTAGKWYCVHKWLQYK